MNNIGIKGRFQLQIIEEDGYISFDSGEQKNLITDSALGYSSFPPSGPLMLCLGAGVVTVPSTTDTNLGNQVAAKSIDFSSNSKVSGISESLGIAAKKWSTVDFTGLNATISELGLKVGSSSGTLLTRALLKNSDGNAITVAILPSQTLRLTYTLHYFFPHKINEGVTQTPHGDLSWEMTRYKEPNGDFTAIHANQEWGFGGGSDIRIAGIVASGAAVYDTSVRKSTLTASIPAQANDVVLSTGDSILRANGNLYSSYHIALTAPYTIPANYIFDMSAEICWGRMA